MTWWGLAHAHGPYINAPMSVEQGEQAFAAISRAQELADNANQVDRALIEALAQRYVVSPSDDRLQLDRSYADEMRNVWRSYPGDSDVGVLFAEALMVLRPWDYWTRDGRPYPETDEIITTLEAVLALDSMHVGANHYYIHVMESSPHPEKGLPAAERLGRLAPGIGHLVHMPGHIYMRLGRYGDAVAVNERSVEIVRAHNALEGYPPNDFEVAHNLHFLSYAAMFEGRFERALSAAREIRGELSEETLAVSDLAEEVLGAVYHVLVRFGRWNEILAEPPPEQHYPYTRAMWHYARGVAAANTDQFDIAHAELIGFQRETARVPDGFHIFVVPASDVLNVARHMLVGEIDFRSGDLQGAIANLRDAVDAEDALPYSEPSPWMQPVRHALGAVLLEAGQFREAEEVYREDLARHPDNVWSLHGLLEILHQTGRDAEARSIQIRFEEVERRTDVLIRSSCYCREGDGV
jgi:tetratricopeptide (TPR) repeat protein